MFVLTVLVLVHSMHTVQVILELDNMRKQRVCRRQLEQLIFASLVSVCILLLNFFIYIASKLNYFFIGDILLFYLTGSFGNGVLSFFTFLKWLLQLNVYIFILTLCFVIIPQAISTGKELPLNPTPQNASNTTTTSSSSSTVAPTTVTESPVVRRRRDVTPNATEGIESNRKCHLVKPNDYSLYTDKPFAQLLSDFFSGIVSDIFEVVVMS